METEIDPIETLTLQPVSAAPVRRSVADPWLIRLRDAASLYIPLLLMGALTAFLWWLVRTTDTPASSPIAAPYNAAPDYWLDHIVMQRYGASGQLLANLKGQQLRHLPATREIEIQVLSFTSWPAQGAPIYGSAKWGRTDDAGQDVVLQGHALLTREATATNSALRYESQTLRYNTQNQIASSDQPVRLTLSSPPTSIP